MIKLKRSNHHQCHMAGFLQNNHQLHCNVWIIPRFWHIWWKIKVSHAVLWSYSMKNPLLPLRNSQLSIECFKDSSRIFQDVLAVLLRLQKALLYSLDCTVQHGESKNPISVYIYVIILCIAAGELMWVISGSVSLPKSAFVTGAVFKLITPPRTGASTSVNKHRWPSRQTQVRLWSRLDKLNDLISHAPHTSAQNPCYISCTQYGTQVTRQISNSSCLESSPTNCPVALTVGRFTQGMRK